MNKAMDLDKLKYDYLLAGICTTTDYEGWRNDSDPKSPKWDDLKELRITAERFAKKLSAKKAHVVGAYDATTASIKTTVEKLAQRVQTYREKHRNCRIGVVFYLAGHGDAEKDKPVSRFYGKRRPELRRVDDVLNTQSFQSELFSELDHAHHILFILDCCEAAAAFSKKRAMGQPAVEAPRIRSSVHELRNAIKSRGREVLYTSRGGQSAYLDQDGSDFLKSFLSRVDALQVATTSTVAKFVQHDMRTYRQMPLPTKVDNCEGEFVLGLSARLKEPVEQEKGEVARPNAPSGTKPWQRLTKRQLLCVGGFGLIGAGILLKVFSSRDSPLLYQQFPAMVGLLPHLVCLERGYYGKEGLIVEEETFQNSVSAVKSLVDGNIAFLPAISLVDIATSALGRTGSPILVLAHSRIPHRRPMDALVQNSGFSIGEVTKEDPQRIGVVSQTSARAVKSWFMKKHSVNLHDSQFKFFKDESKMLQEAGDGTLLCAHVYEPFVTIAAHDDRLTKAASSPFQEISTFPSPIGCSGISRRYFDSNPESVERLARAWNLAIKDIEKDVKSAYALLAKKFDQNNKDAVIDSHHAWIWMTESQQADDNRLRLYISDLTESGILDQEGDLPKTPLTYIDSRS